MHDASRDICAVKHIYSYCLEIERTLEEIYCDRENFDRSNTHRNALALCVLQIGEIVGVLTDSFKIKNSEIPWKDIKQMRNIIAHKYGTFDFDVLWEVVTCDIPVLKAFCECVETKGL